MGRTITETELVLKVKFLNKFMDEKFIFILEKGSDGFVLTKDYGLKGSDCVLVDTLQKCNTYLNRYIHKNDLRDMWDEFKYSKK